MGAAIAQKGDTAASLVERARADRLARREDLLDAPRAAPARQNSYRRDARKIREELAEEIRVPGACCRDYETFRSIYRFLERGIIRSGQKSCVILLSLTDREGQIIPPEDKDRLMDRPGEDIRRTLRLGDLYPISAGAVPAPLPGVQAEGRPGGGGTAGPAVPAGEPGPLPPPVPGAGGQRDAPAQKIKGRGWLSSSPFIFREIIPRRGPPRPGPRSRLRLRRPRP